MRLPVYEGDRINFWENVFNEMDALIVGQSFQRQRIGQKLLLWGMKKFAAANRIVCFTKRLTDSRRK